MRGIFLALLLLLMGQHTPSGSVAPTVSSSYTVIQSVANTVDGTFAVAITPGATGRLLSGVASVGVCTASSATVADTAANTWVIDKNFYDTFSNTWLVFHAFANGTSATTVTVSPGVTCPHGGVGVSEVSGVTAVDSPSITAASSVPSTFPTLVMTTLHSGEFCSIIGNLATFTATFSTLVAIPNVGGLGGTQQVGGPSTGTSTTFASTVAYGDWALAGACYK